MFAVQHSAEEITAVESVNITLAHIEQVSPLDNQDSKPWVQVTRLTPVP